MTLKDISNGPEWSVWVSLAILVLMTIAFLTGHGGNLIAGYNTMPDEDKEKYDIKKMCKIVGYGFVIIDIVVLAMILGEAILPAWTAYVVLAIILLDCLAIIILANTICKKK